MHSTKLELNLHLTIIIIIVIIVVNLTILIYHLITFTPKIKTRKELLAYKGIQFVKQVGLDRVYVKK